MKFTTALTLLFIGLKLAEIITWSWWLVLSPTIAGISITIILFMIAVYLEMKSK